MSCHVCLILSSPRLAHPVPRGSIHTLQLTTCVCDFCTLINALSHGHIHLSTHHATRVSPFPSFLQIQSPRQKKSQFRRNREVHWALHPLTPPSCISECFQDFILFLGAIPSLLSLFSSSYYIICIISPKLLYGHHVCLGLLLLYSAKISRLRYSHLFFSSPSCFFLPYSPTPSLNPAYLRESLRFRLYPSR